MFIACLVSLAGCNNNSSTGTETAGATRPAKEPVKSKLNDEGTKKLMSVISNYYTLKNAMVAAKSADAVKAAAQLAAATDSFQTYLQHDSANMAAVKPYTDTIIAQSKLAAAIDDPSCEKQRLAFGPISSAMYGLIKKVDLKNAKIYHEYCPMAFNDKGATWLSEESEIKNPYFGKKMMECGEVTDSL